MRVGMINRAETFARRWRSFEAESPKNRASAKEIASLVLKLREQQEQDRDYEMLRGLIAPHREALGLDLEKNRCFRLWFEAIAFHLIQGLEEGAAAH